MKPITEHPEFKDIAPNFSNHSRTAMYDGGEILSAYNDGAKAAQSILQKEHEREMEELMRWAGTNGWYYCRFSEAWKNQIKLEIVTASFTQLLQLFRERDKE